MPITEVISRVFAGLGLQNRAYEPVLDCIQASSTAQADGTYTGHIHMRREPQRVEFTAGSYRRNALLAQLQSAFPAH